MCSSVEQKIELVETTLSNRFDGLVHQIQYSNISQAVSSVLSEERGKDKRQLNLVLQNVPESIIRVARKEGRMTLTLLWL